MAVFVVGEAGVNHNGDIALALKMVDEAKKAGCDAVKFQTFKAERFVSRFAPKALYQEKVTSKKESHLEMVRKLELNRTDYEKLIKRSKEKNIAFLCTPFDIEGVNLLDELGLDAIKIPSGEITNLPLLRKAGRLKKKIIMSTGMADLDEIRKALDILIASGTLKDNITLLHCNTEYPTPYEDVNLRAMLTIRDAFGVKVGYSDHTPGIEVPVAAVVLGASFIEKHFTLDKNMPGPDHKASLEPDELKVMVTAVRNVEKSLGEDVKKPSPSESKNIVIARKSIVAKKNIKKGDVFTDENITAKRPASGINPMEWDNVIGKTAKKDFKEDEFIEI